MNDIPTSNQNQKLEKIISSKLKKSKQNPRHRIRQALRACLPLIKSIGEKLTEK